MKNIILVLKGFIMGIANIIPGVSGGTLAITLGIYEKFIDAISHFMKNIKENIMFLLPVVIGMGLSLVTMSNVVSYAFDKLPIPTTLFFMGLVIGGIPLITSKVSKKKDSNKTVNYIITFLTFALVIVLAFSNEIFGSGLGNANFENIDLTGYILLLLVGMVAAGTMIIPGISGSLVLMLLGYYLPVVDCIKEFTHFKNIGSNFFILGFFGVGVLVGIVLIAKLIEWLLKKYETKTYYGVIGFIVASVIAIPVSVYHELGSIEFDLISVLLGFGCLILGGLVGNKLGEK